MWRYKILPSAWADFYDTRKMIVNNWPEIYRRKLVSAEEAAALVKSGDRLRLNAACAWPTGYVRALMKRKNELENVRIEHVLTLELTDPSLNYSAPDCKGHFFCGSWFTTNRPLKEAIWDGRAAHVPHNFGENHLIQFRYLMDDFFVTEVSAPDKFGFCSVSTCVSHVPESLITSKKVVFEINDKQPRGLGPEAMVHISQADYLIENSHPLPELLQMPPSEMEKTMGSMIADLIEDGSTIQLGIGGLPGAVAMFLKDKRNLGLHSEMLGDAALFLVKEGAMDGFANSIRPGKLVYTFAMGSKELYDFVDDNPMLEAWPVSFTNNPAVIANNTKQIAINAAIEVNLTGQVCSESIGHKHYSGTGGQLLFTLGSFSSPGGKSFITLPSTQMVKGQPVSTIVMELKPGAVVTTPRTVVDYVVTEQGVAQLKGKDCPQRAKELIAVAHPDFRDQLRFEARKENLI